MVSPNFPGKYKSSNVMSDNILYLFKTRIAHKYYIFLHSNTLNIKEKAKQNKKKHRKTVGCSFMPFTIVHNS